MIRARQGDWLADVEGGLNTLRDICDTVVAAGLSMGGLLALWAGAQQAVQAVICLSTPLAMPRSRVMRFARIFSWLIPYVPKGAPNWHDPEAADGHVTYPAYPTRAAVELRDLMRDVRRILPEVRVPLLIVQARGDRAVSADSMSIILQNVGSADKRTLWLEDSGHVITRDRQRQAVFTAVSEFIAQTVGLPT
jgi:carboxylesterase